MSFLESSYPQSGSLMLHFPPPPKNPEAGRVQTSVNMRFVAIVSNCRNIRLSLYFIYILYICCFHKKIIQDYNELHLSAKLRHCSSSRPEVAEYDSVLLSAALCPPAAQNHLARWNKRVGEWYADGWELQIELHVLDFAEDYVHCSPLIGYTDNGSIRTMVQFWARPSLQDLLNKLIRLMVKPAYWFLLDKTAVQRRPRPLNRF